MPDNIKQPEGTKGVRILVVEDERKVAQALQEGLEASQYEVTVTHSGEEGFFLVNEQTFDLVLLDLMLPGRDGLEVLTTLRKRGLQTPVLILTAKDEVAVEVRDDGPGMAPEHHLRIFERFYRVDKERSRAIGGAGLGLAIAKWAVEVNGGRIDLDSAPGKGSVFSIVLPG